VVEHNINSESLSCEAIKYTNQLNKFNALQWLTSDMNQTIGFNTHSSQISKYLFNYTSLFPYQSPLIKNNSIYKCCTILNGVIQQCQQFLANIKINSTQKNDINKIYFTNFQTTKVTKTSTSKLSTKIVSTLRNEENNDNTKELQTNKIEKKLKVTASILVSITATLPVVTQSYQISNSIVGIIIACTGGVIILSLVIILSMLCYKRHRYGAVYLNKSSFTGKHLASSLQDNISDISSSNEAYKVKQTDLSKRACKSSLKFFFKKINK
jgi:hypothetical protein